LNIATTENDEQDKKRARQADEDIDNTANKKRKITHRQSKRKRDTEIPERAFYENLVKYNRLTSRRNIRQGMRARKRNKLYVRKTQSSKTMLLNRGTMGYIPQQLVRQIREQVPEHKKNKVTSFCIRMNKIILNMIYQNYRNYLKNHFARRQKQGINLKKLRISKYMGRSEFPT